MSYIGGSKTLVINKSTEKESRFTKEYVSTGGETAFNITFNGSQVNVTINGIRLKKYDDFTPLNNNRILLAEPTSNGDIIQCEGFYTYHLNNSNDVLINIQDVNDAIANATYYVTHDELNVQTQTITTEYSTAVANSANTLTTSFDNKLSMYNKRTEKGTHTAFYNASIITYDIVVEVGENAMIIGPVEIGDDAVFTVNGTLTVV